MQKKKIVSLFCAQLFLTLQPIKNPNYEYINEKIILYQPFAWYAVASASNGKG